MRVVVFIAALTLCACSPSAPTTQGAETSTPAAPVAASNSAAEFQAPSGNIGCDYTPAGGTAVYKTADNAAELKCDRIEPAYVRITLPEHGAARIEPTQERGCCGGETLAHGAHWAAGPFQCDMSEAGLTCANAEGHGFTLSREQMQVH